MSEFEFNIKETQTYKKFLRKIDRNYARIKKFDELLLVETISNYNIYLNELPFNKHYFFKCRDSIDNLYRYYYKHYVLKTLKNKSTEEILSTLDNNIKRVYTYNQVRKTLILIIYYDTLLNYYTNQLSEDDKIKIVFGLNRIIEYYTNFYKKAVVTKYKCKISVLLNDNFSLDKLETDFKFKNNDEFYKSPDNSVWINTKTKKIEDMSIRSQNGLYEVCIKKFKEYNIIHYAVT